MRAHFTSTPLNWAVCSQEGERVPPGYQSVSLRPRLLAPATRTGQGVSGARGTRRCRRQTTANRTGEPTGLLSGRHRVWERPGSASTVSASSSNHWWLPWIRSFSGCFAQTISGHRLPIAMLCLKLRWPFANDLFDVREQLSLEPFTAAEAGVSFDRERVSPLSTQHTRSLRLSQTPRASTPPSSAHLGLGVLVDR